MDTQDVIDLTGRAVDSVLRFRTVAFHPRPVFDVKSFKATIATNIIKLAKEEGNRFETPLADVVNYAGVSASRAVQSWNKASDKENHIDRDWFRNCVCDLVSGVVNDIGHKAFQTNELNASEYLDPDDYDPFGVSTYSTERRSNSSSSSSEVGLAYYGFARAPKHQSTNYDRSEGDDGGERDSQQLPMRHEINRGLQAIQKLAASHTSKDSTANFVRATASLRRKRSTPSDGNEDSSPGLQLKGHRAKRPRASDDSPTAAASLAIRATGGQSAAGTKRPVVRVSWTEEEVQVMLKSREDGKDWDFIHARLPRHTRAACQKKYRDVIRQRGEQQLSVAGIDESKAVNSPGSGSQGDEEDVVRSEQDE